MSVLVFLKAPDLPTGAIDYKYPKTFEFAFTNVVIFSNCANVL
jgi:hypothetical protein